MDDVHKLRIFAAVAYSLSFTRAAQSLHPRSPPSPMPSPAWNANSIRRSFVSRANASPSLNPAECYWNIPDVCSPPSMKPPPPSKRGPARPRPCALSVSRRLPVPPAESLPISRVLPRI